MRKLVPIASFLFLLSSPVAVRADDNPYMPGGGSPGGFSGIPDFQQQQIIQQLMSAGDDGEAPPQAGDDGPAQPGRNQADVSDAMTREKADREREIQALKDAFNTQIQDLQRRLDQQQNEIDNLRYKDHM